jgi:8-oxo-dGTP diphosphatase
MFDDFIYPRVGVAVIIKDESGKILIGKRVSEHGRNTWSIPGGHLEKFETPEECVIRETKEECGIDIEILKPDIFVNNFFKETNKHYITLYFVAKKWSGTPIIKEPNKITEWTFCDITELPDNLFSPFANYINIKNKRKRSK